MDRTVFLWEKIAERYKDQKWLAGYDLLNEPGGALGLNNLIFTIDSIKLLEIKIRIISFILKRFGIHIIFHTLTYMVGKMSYIPTIFMAGMILIATMHRRNSSIIKYQWYNERPIIMYHY